VPSSILSHQYENGLVLVAEPIQSLESVAFSFLTPAGCRYDPDQRDGLAAFSCEMALRGAGNRDSRRFVQELEILGVERNESVGNSHISYGGATLASNLLPALEIYTDLLRRPLMPAEHIEAGRKVVLQELEGIEDEPSHKVMLELRRHHYPEPYGRSSQGEREAIEAITIDDIRDFYSQAVRPNGTILGVAGQLDWPRLVDHVGELLGDWQTSPEPGLGSGPTRPRLRHIDFESNQTQIGIAYDSVPYSHPDYYQASGAIGVLSGGMSSRLFTEVREKRGLCYSVYASLHTLREQGSVICYAGTSSERAQETLDVTLGELRRLSAGVSANELKRLKARVKSGLIMQQESSAARSSALARDWYHLGTARTLDEVGAIVDALTCESINTYLHENPPQSFTIVTLGPSPLEVSLEV
jgi:predicted Zn-dependent peptidase